MAVELEQVTIGDVDEVVEIPVDVLWLILRVHAVGPTPAARVTLDDLRRVSFWDGARHLTTGGGPQAAVNV